MNIKEIQEELVGQFAELDDWEDKYTRIIRMGKELPVMNEEKKTDKNKLDGCQSQVWIDASFEDGKIFIEADSDAAIVKGLIAILVKVYSGHKPDEILSSPPDFLKSIGIDNQLSPTRKNGLGAMLKQIQMYAVAFRALSNK